MFMCTREIDEIVDGLPQVKDLKQRRKAILCL